MWACAFSLFFYPAARLICFPCLPPLLQGRKLLADPSSNSISSSASNDTTNSTTAAPGAASDDLWNTTAPCGAAPNATNSVQDQLMRLWGWEHGSGCAFKAADHNPIYYPGYSQRAVWATAPACTAAPNATNSKPDTNGRLWGWENEANCVFNSTSNGTAAAPRATATAAAPSANGTVSMMTNTR